MSGHVMKISRGARHDRWRQHVNRLFPQFPFSSVVAMTAFVDSQAVLELRLKHAGMADKHVATGVHTQLYARVWR